MLQLHKTLTFSATDPFSILSILLFSNTNESILTTLNAWLAIFRTELFRTWNIFNEAPMLMISSMFTLEMSTCCFLESFSIRISFKTIKTYFSIIRSSKSPLKEQQMLNVVHVKVKTCVAKGILRNKDITAIGYVNLEFTHSFISWSYVCLNKLVLCY